MLRISAIITGLAMVASAPAWAEGGGEPFRGSAYAEEMCQSCHSITADNTASANPAAKPFRSIDISNLTGESLATFVNTKHPSITGPLLKPQQGEDIVSFIATLKPKAG